MKGLKFISGIFLLIFSLTLFFSVSFISAGTLQVTEEHPFLVNGQWVDASDLVAGDDLQTIDGKNVKITSIEDVVLKDNFSVYNLEAKEYSDFVVNGGDGLGVVVHNSDMTFTRKLVRTSIGLFTIPTIFGGVILLTDGFYKEAMLSSKVDADLAIINYFQKNPDSNYVLVYGGIDGPKKFEFSQIPQILKFNSDMYRGAVPDTWRIWTQKEIVLNTMYNQESWQNYLYLMDSAKKINNQQLTTDKKIIQVYNKLQSTMVSYVGPESDQGFNFNTALKNRQGVCRHKSILLQKMLQEIGVESNQMVTWSHVWLRVKTADRIFDLDPMNFLSYYEINKKDLPN